LTVDASALSVGTYNATVVVDSPGLWRGPIQVPIRVTVVTRPADEHRVYLPTVGR
jgi:hypothetical protein